MIQHKIIECLINAKMLSVFPGPWNLDYSHYTLSYDRLFARKKITLGTWKQTYADKKTAFGLERIGRVESERYLRSSLCAEVNNVLTHLQQ